MVDPVQLIHELVFILSEKIMVSLPLLPSLLFKLIITYSLVSTSTGRGSSLGVGLDLSNSGGGAKAFSPPLDSEKISKLPTMKLKFRQGYITYHHHVCMHSCVQAHVTNKKFIAP